jgi:hypothetical protein
MTIESAPAVGFGGLIDMSSDGRNDGGAEGDVGNKVTVPIKSA